MFMKLQGELLPSNSVAIRLIVLLCVHSPFLSKVLLTSVTLFDRRNIP